MCMPEQIESNFLYSITHKYKREAADSRCTGVWDRAGRYAFAIAVEATHDCEFVVLSVGLVEVGGLMVGAKSCASGFLASALLESRGKSFYYKASSIHVRSTLRHGISDYILHRCPFT